MKAAMTAADADDTLVSQLRSADYLHDQVKRVSTARRSLSNRGHKVVLMDFRRNSVYPQLSKQVCDLIVVPWNTDAGTDHGVPP